MKSETYLKIIQNYELHQVFYNESIHEKDFIFDLVQYVEQSWKKNTNCVLNGVQKKILQYMEKEDWKSCFQIIEKYKKQNAVHLINHWEEKVINYFMTKADIKNLSYFRHIFSNIQDKDMTSYIFQYNHVDSYDSSFYSRDATKKLVNDQKIIKDDPILKIIMLTANFFNSGHIGLNFLNQLHYSGEHEEKFKQDFIASVIFLNTAWIEKEIGLSNIVDEPIKKIKRKI